MIGLIIFSFLSSLRRSFPFDGYCTSWTLFSQQSEFLHLSTCIPRILVEFDFNLAYNMKFLDIYLMKSCVDLEKPYSALAIYSFISKVCPRIKSLTYMIELMAITSLKQHLLNLILFLFLKQTDRRELKMLRKGQ